MLKLRKTTPPVKPSAKSLHFNDTEATLVARNKHSPATGYKSSIAGGQGWRSPTRLRKGQPLCLSKSPASPAQSGFSALRRLSASKPPVSIGRRAPRRCGLAATWRCGGLPFGLSAQSCAETPGCKQALVPKNTKTEFVAAVQPQLQTIVIDWYLVY